jgi:hypothetical protein
MQNLRSPEVQADLGRQIKHGCSRLDLECIETVRADHRTIKSLRSRFNTLASLVICPI